MLANFKARSDEHLSRKFFHAFAGTLIAFLYVAVFSRKQSIAILISITSFLIVLDFARLHIARLNRFIIRIYGPLMRANEEREPSAQLHYMLGLSWAVFFLPKPIGVQAILTLAWMDPVAAIVGVRFGHISWGSIFSKFFVGSRTLELKLGAKTVEGSLAGFLVAALAGIIAWTGPWASYQVGNHLWWPETSTILVFSVVGGLTAIVAEAWPSQWDDNVNIPFWTGLVLWALSVALSIPLRVF